MTELHWTPEDIGRLTIPQLVCLLKKEPGGRESLTCFEDFARTAERESSISKTWDD